MQFGKFVEVFAVVLVPVSAGDARPGPRPFAERADKPVRIGSAVILAVLVVGILVDQRDKIGE